MSTLYDLVTRADKDLQTLRAELQVLFSDMEQLQKENQELRAKLAREAPPWRDTLAD